MISEEVGPDKTQAEEIPNIGPFIADRVEITFRDQLASRRDMWKI
jgi:hypothetical protein